MKLTDEKLWKISFFHEDWTYPNGGEDPEPIVFYATHDDVIGMTEQSKEFRTLLEKEGGYLINGALTSIWEQYCDDETAHFTYPGGPSFNKYFEAGEGIHMRQRLENVLDDDPDQSLTD
tara:strand:- start:251 stop:607 length:357 start_codon:yes stop_codon:yes gene_type:complete